MRSSPNFLVLACVLAAAGCSDPKPAKTAADVTESAAEREPKEAAKSPKTEDKATDNDENIAKAGIDERIAKMCDLREPRFEFNSAELKPSAQRVVEAIAKCFLDGPGKGKDIAIVGHADPRGDEDTNFALGQRRAGAVAGFLKKAGLTDDRISTSSRGELDATGTDEAGWAQDRKADIKLAR